MFKSIVEIMAIIGASGAILAIIIMVFLGWLPYLIRRKLPYKYFPKTVYFVGCLVFISHFAFTLIFLDGSLFEANSRFTDWIMVIGVALFCAGLWPFFVMGLFINHAKKKIFEKANS